MEFQEWFERTIAHEGGFVFDPADKGGATSMGITQESYSEFKDRKVTVDEMENMSLDDAREFYEDYWSKLGMEGLPEAIIPFYSDAAVNLGRGGATKVIQMALNTKNNIDGPDEEGWVDVDGLRGSGTNQAIAAARLSAEDYLAELMVWYANLVLDGCRYTGRTNQNRFIRGWTRRLLENYKESS
jgi:lysozyme family protein